MMEKFSEKDVRAIKMGAVGVAAILLFVFGSSLYGRWNEAKKNLAELENKLELIDLNDAKSAGLKSIVPVFEMPAEKETQKFLFLEELNRQLQSLRITSKPLQEVTGGKSPDPKYKLLRLKCSVSNCRFDQVLDLLANLKQNPYLLGIEEMRIKCDSKNRQQVDLELTISTLTK